MAIATLNAGAGEHPDHSETSETLVLRKLGISPKAELTYYELLGIREGETDALVIESAAAMRLSHLHSLQMNKGLQSAVNDLKSKVTRAQSTLLDAAKRANYDETLRARRAREDTRANLAAVVPDMVSPNPAPLTTVTEKRRTPSSPWQRYGSHIAMGIVGTVAAVGTALWATSGDGRSEDNDARAAAKAPKEPGSGELRAIPTENESSEEIRDALPAIDEAKPATHNAVTAPQSYVATEPAQATFQPSAFVAAEPTTETPATPAPAKPAETLVAQLPPQEAAKPAFDKEEYAQNREKLLKALHDKKGVEQIDEMLTLASNAEIVKDPERAKAVFVEAFLGSVRENSLPRAYRAARHIFDHPEWFAKQEIDYTVGQLKALASTSSDRMTAFTVLELLRQKGYVSLEEEFGVKLAHYKKEIRTPAFRKETPAFQQAMAAEMLTVAQGWTNDAPELADQLARDAKFAFGPVSRETKPVKDAFDEKVNMTLKTIAQAKEFKKASDTLAGNPENAEARRVRGEIHFERGNVTEGLADLAKSDHQSLAALAHDTESIFSRADSVSAAVAYDTAEKWRKESLKANGKKATMEHVELKLLGIALAAQKDPIDPYVKPKVQLRVNALRSALGAPAPAVVVQSEVKPASTDTQATTPEKDPVLVGEPKRPEYVLKEAVWNEKTSSWYYLAPEPMTLPEVAKFAAQHSAMVAAPEDMEENHFIYRLQGKDKNSDIWTGLVKGPDGKLYTPEGKPIAFENWNNGEGSMKGEKYVFLMWGAKHADSYPDVKKAKGVIKWKYVSPKSSATDRSVTGKRPR